MAGNLGGSTPGGVGGGSTGGTVAGGAAGATRQPNGGAGALGRLLAGAPLPLHDHLLPSTGGTIDYLRTAWGADHLAAADPHPVYATDADLLALPTDADVAGAIATHEAAADPHPGYLTPAEGDAAYALVGHTHPSEQSGPWRFQDTAGGTPGAGYLRTNTGVLATAGQLLISRTTQDGYDIPPPGWGVTAGDTIYIQDRDDSTKWVRYTALEPLVRYPTYATGLVTVSGHAGSTIVNGQIIQVTFSLAGGGGGGAGGVVATDALWDAKGDLAAGTGADAAARLAVGTNGTFLSADSAQTTGLAWVANPVTAHAALPNAHHAQDHNHTAADGSGALSNDEHDGYSQYANLGADPTQPATNKIRLYSKDNGAGVATLYYRTEDGTIYELPTLTTGGGGGSGAPANATYITTGSEAKLSAERVLGTAVIMSGVLSGRPAFGTAGRLYLATDTDLVYRDTGSAWETFATRAAAGGGLPTTGGTLTGALVLQGAASTTNVLQAKIASDTQPRFRADAAGLLEWGPGGAVAPDVSVSRSGTGALTVAAPVVPAATNTHALGGSTASWNGIWGRFLEVTDNTGYLRLGSSNTAASGAARLRNGTNVAWRNAGNTADLALTMDSSDRLSLTVGAGALTTTATAGTAGALPAQVSTYLTIVLNGTTYKLPAYLP